MGEKMTLTQVRDWLARKERMYVGYQTWATSLSEKEVRAFRCAIDAHLATPAQTVDVEAVKGVIDEMQNAVLADPIELAIVFWTDKLSQAIGDKT